MADGRKEKRLRSVCSARATNLGFGGRFARHRRSTLHLEERVVYVCVSAVPFTALLQFGSAAVGGDLSRDRPRQGVRTCFRLEKILLQILHFVMTGKRSRYCTSYRKTLYDMCHVRQRGRMKTS